ncbi:DUF808 domain-containing protein [Corynebacterium mendelii]|uniref:DUF808 domain-containing protein n=1 Tax=Corynebacterium mendelii TaxID=2765362 RepID=A0A939E177_9CORY|nr:DUF808 domain-containing protein [Corynebacterium mendelii]MBN9644818.1 DUF808 domain-containing protein [Corynebacterium mendelii]
MAGGLAALLDDVALIARKAAAQVDDVAAAAGRTSAKAAGVVVDDAAVTPRFVRGVSPKRELPIIWRITKGSLFNKLVIILPLALLLSWIAPWALTPLLMIGGTYLSFEGAEKFLEMVGAGHHEQATAAEKGAQSEDQLVRGAVTTDLILSAEIMVISLNEVADQPFTTRLSVLAVVAVAMTALVYGAVGLLVKIDDIGLRLAKRPSKQSKKIGLAMVDGMPKILNAIAVIGTFAMLWVGGHIMLVGVGELFWAAPVTVVHHLAHTAGTIPGIGGLAAWLTETGFSMVAGLAWGVVIVAVVAAVRRTSANHPR